MKKINEIFNSISDKGYYILYDRECPTDVRLGIDSKGRKSLRIESNFKPVKVQSTKKIEVNHFELTKTKAVTFSLTEESSQEIFYLLCEDLIKLCYLDEKTIYENVISRYKKWIEIFSNQTNNLLSENEIIGLLGELIFLDEYLLSNYEQENAIASWAGVEKTHKDFSIDNTWFEIKTTTSKTKNIKISSIEQLESDHDGYLIAFTLEKMSPEYEGITINKVFKNLISKLNENSKIEFIKKITQAGFFYDAYYNDYVYSLIGKSKFLVNEKFPKLSRKNLSKSIVSASYELNIETIKEFEVNLWV